MVYYALGLIFLGILTLRSPSCPRFGHDIPGSVHGTEWLLRFQILEISKRGVVVVFVVAFVFVFVIVLVIVLVLFVQR